MSALDEEIIWAISTTGEEFQCVHVDFAKELWRDVQRYRWLREHGAWETEAFLNGLSAEQYDKALDERMLTV